MHFLDHIQLLFDVILYLPIFTKRQSKNILGNERNNFISHCWTIWGDNAKPANSIPGSWYRATAVLMKFWFSDCWFQDFELGLASPSLQTARNYDQFNFQSQDPWPCHSAHYIVAHSSKAWMKFKDPYFILQLKWPDFLCPWEKAAPLCSFFSEHMLNFAIFGMFSQWEVSISIQCIAITSLNTKLVMDAEPVLCVMKNACRKSWLC